MEGDNREKQSPKWLLASLVPMNLTGDKRPKTAAERGKRQ
ncbi:hypothetical protein SAMCFNEI73_Ch1433 [Sinorhizobium americanum]|uniref:Uncharacterized protein n=1 Tax=Sinorhizobium americanum TaxID=194963 RepID=A0A1L3LKV8_9HYPH|nr:hypothetical protein SAMCFNEI73_Ch1433 [Sinorhizobium americanum]